MAGGEINRDTMAAIAEQFAAFGELALGYPKLRIGNASVDAITTDAEFDEVAVAGGVAEAGGFRATIKKEDHPTRPAELAIVQRRVEPPLQVLTVKSQLATWEIVAGDPVIQEKD